MGRIHTLRGLFLGASNNGGNDGGNGTPSDWYPLVRQVAWNNSSAGPDTNGTALVANTMGSAPHDQVSGDNEAPGPWAMKVLLDGLWPIRNAQLISHTQPGAIEQWAGSGQTEFDHVVAVHAASGLPPMDYFSWIQGGTDANAAAGGTIGDSAWDTYCETTYPAWFDDLRSGLISAGVLSADVKTVISGLSIPIDDGSYDYRSSFNTDCFIPLAAATPNCAYVDVEDLATRATDNVHFTSASYVTSGERIGAAFLSLL